MPFFFVRLSIDKINGSIKLSRSIGTILSFKSPYSILDKSIKSETINDNLSELCKMALANTFASFLLSNAPSSRVSELALITLTGVLNS